VRIQLKLSLMCRLLRIHFLLLQPWHTRTHTHTHTRSSPAALVSYLADAHYVFPTQRTTDTECNGDWRNMKMMQCARMRILKGNCFLLSPSYSTWWEFFMNTWTILKVCCSTLSLPCFCICWQGRPDVLQACFHLSSRLKPPYYCLSYGGVIGPHVTGLQFPTAKVTRRCETTDRLLSSLTWTTISKRSTNYVKVVDWG